MVELTLPAEPRAAAVARAHVRDLPVGPDMHEVLSLLVTELVTNAVRHGRADDANRILVHLDVPERGLVRMDVVDGGPGFNRDDAMADRYPDGGLGLKLVDRLAERWGVEANGETKVWLEVRRAA